MFMAKFNDNFASRKSKYLFYEKSKYLQICSFVSSLFVFAGICINTINKIRINIC